MNPTERRHEALVLAVRAVENKSPVSLAELMVVAGRFDSFLRGDNQAEFIEKNIDT